MPYPNSNILNIVIPQTSASKDGTQAPFVETIISGSRLILQTDTTGTLIGSSDINVNNITASNISASGYISSSNLYVKTNITDAGTLNVVGESTLAGLTGTTATFSGLVSASAGLTASAIQDAGTLTVVGNSTLSNVFATNITGSNISASGNISSSNLWVQNSIVDNGTLTVIGNSTLSNVFLTNLTASNISASNKIIASEITASSEVFVGTGQTYRTYGEAFAPENLARLYVSGSVSVVSKYATLNLATSASAASAQSSILFSRLADRDPGTGVETVLEPRWQIGTESGSNDLRLYAYYVSSDPDNIAQGVKGQNIVAGARVVMKQNGYFGIGNFYNYGLGGGAKTTYQSVLPGYNITDNTVPYYGPDALLTLLPMDSGSTGTAGSKEYNRNILNIMSYDTSSIMFISGSDGYILLGKNTTDGINRLQVVGNVSASAYTGSSARFTNLISTNITASNISASGYISASDAVFSGDIAVNGGDITTTSTTATLFNTNATTVNIGGGATSQVLLGNATGLVKAAGDLVVGTNTIKDGSGGLAITVGSVTTTIAGDLQVDGNDIKANGGNTNLILGTNELTVPLELVVSNNTNATSYTSTTAALQVDGGARISKDTWISGSLNVAGDFTVFGSSSVVYISSSTVIINDNIIQLNAYFPYERYSGFEVFDSGSNQRSASLLWDGQTDNWITVDQVNSSSNIIIGPTASFGSSITSLTVNRLTKAYEGNAISDSALSDDGTTLSYTGTTISSSRIIATTGSITYITGALVTYVTGSFTTLTIATGSNPGAGAVPVHPTASGMPGQINVDNNFIYVYTNNIWKRVPISNWAL